jgi:adenine-specific DNA-methyltransferase
MLGKKLELHWTNKGKSLYFDLTTRQYEWVERKDPRVSEPRILIEKQNYGDKDTENLLIKGDNLLALKTLMQDFQNKIKLIYIDPPYNTGNAFELYDDGLEHSVWLTLMRDRLLLLQKLLRKDGFICCHIDDSEGHYLKVLMDEVFGRHNYLTTLYIRVRYPEKTLKSDMDFHKEVEQIHVYRNQFGSRPNLNISELSFAKFNFYIEELTKGEEFALGNKRVVLFKKDEYKIQKKEGSENGLKEIWATGTILDGNSSGRFFRDYLSNRYERDGYGVMYKVFGIGDDKFGFRYFTGPQRSGATKGKYFQGVPMKQLNGDDTTRSQPIENFYDLAASFGNCRHEGGVEFRSGKKPERLLEIIIKHFSDEGDVVLDSFAGSGGTGAVAHKMRRKWIMVEFGDHAETHCLKRMQNVITGRDQTGISKAVGWQGGGGFKYFELGDSLFVQDKDLRLTVINPKMYNGALIRAVLKIEGFKLLHPDNALHGISETTVAHVTEQYLSQEYIDIVLKEIGVQAKLIVIYAKTISSKLKIPDHVEVKKLPDILLKKFAV